MTQAISVNVTIVSDNLTLERRILALPAPAQINLSVNTSLTGDATSKDVLIYDAVSMPKVMPETTGCLACILYASLEEDALNLLENPSWTGLWEHPISDALLAFNLRQLFLSVQEKKELVTTTTYLDTLIDSVPDLVWFKDLRGAHLKVNAAFGRAVGKTQKQCEGRGHYYIWDLKPEEYADGEYVCLETEEEVIACKETCLFDEKVMSKNGLRQFKTYKSPLIDAQGEIFGTVGIAKDVTDLQNIGRELDVIFSSIPFAAMIVDTDDSIVSVNNKFCEYFNITAEQIQNMRYLDICSEILETTPQQLTGETMTELRFNSDDKQRVYHAQQQYIHDIFGNHFGLFFLCLDVTNEFELQHKILHSANTDFLTGLYNRRYFYEAISKQQDREQISFVYLDLDDFKLVNDTFGHKWGDDALILMAGLLREAFPEQLIARLGGDEFVVVSFGVCVQEQLAQSVKAFIERAGLVFRSTQNMEVLTVSAGIACNGSVHEVDALLSCADKALYAAKILGKARYEVYVEEK